MFQFTTYSGRPVTVQRVQTDDTVRLREFLYALSDQTRRLRYCNGRPATPEWITIEAKRMASGHQWPHITLLATIEEQGEQEIIAVAELVVDRQLPSQADVAFVIADKLQGEGVGTQLAVRLVDIAQTVGVNRLCADLLAENQAMKRLLHHMGRVHTLSVSYGEIQALVHLASTTTEVRTPTRAYGNENMTLIWANG